MNGPHSTQIISVTLTLAGEQHGRIDAHHAGTPEARLTLLWGSLMLTLTNPAQAQHLHDVWQRAALLARALPQHTTLEPGSATGPRISTAGVVSTLWGLPRWDVRVVADSTTGGHRTPRHVAVRVGGITWQAHDRVAAASTSGLFVRAQALAPTVLKAWPAAAHLLALLGWGRNPGSPPRPGVPSSPPATDAGVTGAISINPDRTTTPAHHPPGRPAAREHPL